MLWSAICYRPSVRLSVTHTKEQPGRGFNLAATSALGHVTVALASAAPELDSTLINKLTDDKRSVVFDGAVRSFTRVDQSKTVEVRIMQLSPQSSPMTLVSSWLTSPRNYKGKIEWARQMREG